MRIKIVRQAEELELVLRGPNTATIHLLLYGNGDPLVRLPSFTRVIQKYKFSLNECNLELHGSGRDAEQLRLDSDNQEISEFFEAIGNLSSLSYLEFRNLKVSIELLTQLLLTSRSDTLACLFFYNTKLLINSTQDVERFTHAVQSLDGCHCIQTINGLEQNPELMTALVKLPKSNLVISVDSAHTTPNKLHWQSIPRNRKAIGVDVIVSSIHLATHALEGNNKNLSMLTLSYPGDNPSEELTMAKIRAFCHALKFNQALDTLDLILPEWAQTVTQELILAMPTIKLRKLIVRWMILSPELLASLVSDLVQALESNYWIEELEIYHKPKTRAPWWTKVRTDNQDFYLRLNRRRRRRRVGGSHYCYCRKDLLSNPTAVTKNQWVENFIALGQDEDLDALYYYLHKYVNYYNVTTQEARVNDKGENSRKQKAKAQTAGKGIKRKHEETPDYDE